MALERFQEVAIPAYQVAANGQVYRDQRQMIELLEGMLLLPKNILIKSQTHALVRVPATLPQHPEGNDVLWTIEYEAEHILPWGNESWQRLTADTVFLQDTQSLLQAYSSSHHHFMHIGYIPEDSEILPYAYRMALQSIPIPHFHQTPESLDGKTLFRTLNPKQGPDLARLMILLNLAGEASINDWHSSLHNFSSNIIQLEQKLPTQHGKTIPYKRTFFGFSSIQEALQQFFELRAHLDPFWRDYAIKVGKSTENTAYIGPGLQRPVTPTRQSAIPNALLVLPTQQDKMYTNKPNDESAVWLSILALCSWNGMRVPYPYYLDR